MGDLSPSGMLVARYIVDAMSGGTQCWVACNVGWHAQNGVMGVVFRGVLRLPHFQYDESLRGALIDTFSLFRVLFCVLKRRSLTVYLVESA